VEHVGSPVVALKPPQSRPVRPAVLPHLSPLHALLQQLRLGMSASTDAASEWPPRVLGALN